MVVARDQPAHRTDHTLADDDEPTADDRRQPGGLHALDQGVPLAAEPEPPGGATGGPVFDEVAEQQQHGHDGGGDAQPTEGNGAQVSHDGGVHQEIERFGGEYDEGGPGQSQQLASADVSRTDVPRADLRPRRRRGAGHRSITSARCHRGQRVPVAIRM